MDYFKTMISIFLRGLLMGISDIMPGISGGTIALITGIYDRLIGSISKINVVRATMNALTSQRSAEHIAELRGKTVEELLG